MSATDINSVSATPPLVGRFVPDQGAARIAALVALAVLGSLILAASAKISVPFWPVPMTMVTGAVALIGASYGMRLAGATVLLYIAEGALGLPVFTSGAGVGYLMGPTGGYIIGFLPAAMLIGWLAERGAARNVATLFGAMILGDAIVFALGLAWLGSVIGWDKPVFASGLFPFIPGDIAKMALAACLVTVGGRLTRR